MTAKTLVLSESPVDIVATLSLLTGKRYLAQNLSQVHTVFGLPKTTSGAPAASAAAFRYESGGLFQIRVRANEKLFMWSDGDAKIILNEI